VVVESAIAPAASVGPSMPSVPTLATIAGARLRRAARRGERELLVAPALARAGDVDRRFAARHDARGRRDRRARQDARSAQTRPSRLADDGVVERRT
jgi:hypothetical protein